MVKNEITKIELTSKATDREYVRVTIEQLDSQDENIIIISNKILKIILVIIKPMIIAKVIQTFWIGFKTMGAINPKNKKKIEAKMK